MGREEYRLAFRLKLLHQVAHLASPHGIEPRHGLIEENHLGFMQDGLRNSHPLQHALRKLAQLHAAYIRQPDPPQDFLDPPRQILAHHPRKPPVIFQQFARGQIVVEVRLLRQESDLRLHRGIIDIHPENARRAARWKHQPHEHFQRGGLASPIGPQKSEDFPFFDIQMKRTQGALRALAPEAHAIRLLQSQNFYSVHAV